MLLKSIPSCNVWPFIAINIAWTQNRLVWEKVEHIIVEYGNSSNGLYFWAHAISKLWNVLEC